MALCRHPRNKYTSCCITLIIIYVEYILSIKTVLPPDKKKKTDTEINAGKNAIIKYIVTGAWRNAIFNYEPGCSGQRSWVGYCADAYKAHI